MIRTNRLRFSWTSSNCSLQQTTAACITETLLNCLQKHGFDDDVLAATLIGFASDGACDDWKKVWCSIHSSSALSSVSNLALQQSSAGVSEEDGRGEDGERRGREKGKERNKEMQGRI